METVLDRNLISDKFTLGRKSENRKYATKGTTALCNFRLVR